MVEERSRIGDWEADTIIGKQHKQALVSLTERKSGLALFYKVERRTKGKTEKAIKQLLSLIANKVHTIIKDNGKEFADHEDVANALSAAIYFAHPYSSLERGLNENTNGLIRQYFPNNRDFTTITEEEINFAMNKLNHRPRKFLGFKTPFQVFSGETSRVALTI